MGVYNLIIGRDARDELLWRLGSGKSVEILDLQVMSGRRRGVGTSLVNDLLDKHLPTGTLTVYVITRASNLIAQQFYQRLRFRPVVLQNFYKDEPLANGKDYADAIMYIKDVGSLA